MRKALLALWDELTETPGARMDAPPLGYRGCALRCEGHGVWHAFGGIVSFGDASRRDRERRFERLILESAPVGVIPEQIFEELGG
jgi:hypothetical protein